MASVPDSASVPSAERERGIEKTDDLRRLKNARNRKFESISLQRRVMNKPEHPVGQTGNRVRRQGRDPEAFGSIERQGSVHRASALPSRPSPGDPHHG
jgi:hypothetical protein